MNLPLVSVFIAAYNAEEYIEECLKSILNQTYKNLEVIIVNDSSTDNTLSIIEKMNDSRIRIINNEFNKGIPYTRNVGLREANGKYLIIMDADDVSALNRIERQVLFMEKNQGIVAAGSDYKYYKKLINKRRVPEKRVTPEEIRIRLLFTSPIANPTSIVRIGMIKKHNIRYNERYFVAQDYDFWFQLSKIGDLAIIPEKLFYYRTGHSNVSAESRRDKAEQRKKIIDEIHKNVLMCFGFDLTSKEIEVYNYLYSDNSEKVNNDHIALIPNLIEKICLESKRNKKFSNQKFMDVFYIYTVIAITNINIGLKDQIDIYKILCKHTNQRMKIKDLVYLITKKMLRHLG